MALQTQTTKKIILILLINILILMFVVLPAREEQQYYQTKNQRLHKSLRQLQRHALLNETHRTLPQKKKKQLVKENKRFFNSRTEFHFIHLLQKIHRQLPERSIQQKITKQAISDHFFRISAFHSYQGTYQDILNYLKILDLYKQELILNKLHIENHQLNSPDPLLQVTAEITFYILEP